MAWRCSGSSNLELIRNLQNSSLITSQHVADAMIRVDRAQFVPPREDAYADAPQSIGFGATISAPHMHAYALENALPLITSDSRILDVGSGSGYLVAVFNELLKSTHDQMDTERSTVKPRVIGIDHLPQLVDLSIDNLNKGHSDALDNGDIQVICRDGRQGYPSLAPFSIIHVGAAAPQLPPALVDQLARPGRMFIPVGRSNQEILQIDKDENGKVTQKSLLGVRYIPLCDREDQWP